MSRTKVFDGTAKRYRSPRPHSRLASFLHHGARRFRRAVRPIQDLARHSDPKLTKRYTDSSMFDIASAPAGLPVMPMSPIDISESVCAAPVHCAGVLSSLVESHVDAIASEHVPSGMLPGPCANSGFDPSGPGVSLSGDKLPGQDSNLKKQIQSLL